MTDEIDPEREPVAAAEFDRQMRKETHSLREQNDAFRTDPALIGERIARDQLVITRGLAARGNAFIDRAMQAVREFSDFTEDNDPWGEHDFGAFELDSVPLYWKIDAYDNELEYGSPNPRDPALTRRVLTIMLAEEY